MSLTLRDYQERAIERIRAALRTGARRILLVAPCGAGKGSILAHLTGQWHARGLRVLVVAHRQELVEDLHARIVAEGVRAGVVMARHKLTDREAPVQVASIQTVVRRAPLVPPPEYIVFDEAHRSVAPTYRTLVEQYPDAIVLGSTATPWRSDGHGLGGLYEDAVVAATPRELMARGWLCEYTGHCFDPPDLRGVRIVAGDYDERQLGAAMSGSVVLGDIVRQWKEQAKEARTVAFACDREHSRRVVADFASAGVPAAHVDGETPAEERREALRKLARGETRVLSNCALFTEGVDVPAIECVILARPTLSTTLALQMIGRGLRPSPSKERLRIHDHAGIIRRHGLPDADRDWSLEADVSAEPKEPEATRTCPKCRAVTERGLEACPECGCAFTRAPREVREQEHAEARSLDEERQVSENAPDGKREAFLALLAQAEKEGRAPGWASGRFRELHGTFPHWRWMRDARFSDGRRDGAV